MRYRGLFLAVQLVTAPALALESPVPADADRDALRAIVEEHDIETTAEQPGVTEYLRDAGSYLLEELAERLEGFAPDLLKNLARVAAVAAQVLFFVVLAALVFLLIKALVAAYRRRLRLDEPPPAAPVSVAPPAAEPGLSRDDWAEKLRRHLGEGDVAAACEALWWWLASSLVESAAPDGGRGTLPDRRAERGRIERSWTSRELIHRTGRRDLTPSVRRLDRMIYGAAETSVDDVRCLWGELEEALS